MPRPIHASFHLLAVDPDGTRPKNHKETSLRQAKGTLSVDTPVTGE
jgi:hypothetical protein